MPKGIKKYRGAPLAMFGPLYNAEGDGGGGSTPPAQPPAGDGQKDDEKLGENGLKALEREREQRKQLEQTVAQMKQAQESQTSALAEALGVKVDKKQSGDDVVAALQKQVADMQRDAAVNRIAREHQITDADDIALIGEARSEEAMAKVAARLVASATPGTPKPDQTQGSKGPAPKPDPGPGVARLAAAFEDELSK